MALGDNRLWTQDCRERALPFCPQGQGRWLSIGVCGFKHSGPGTWQSCPGGQTFAMQALCSRSAEPPAACEATPRDRTPVLVKASRLSLANGRLSGSVSRAGVRQSPLSRLLQAAPSSASCPELPGPEAWNRRAHAFPDGIPGSAGSYLLVAAALESLRSLRGEGTGWPPSANAGVSSF